MSPTFDERFFFKNVIVHQNTVVHKLINSQCLDPGTPVQSMSDGLVAVFS